ncbi:MULTISPECIES: hypothetical protein [unclassified Streptomyces]|uniref:hypothetical protein n=1 Tax=unclassified Streptomyces TaxID=2593676 RepID=UPI00370318CC
MAPADVASAFAYIRAVQAADTDAACAVLKVTGMRMRRLLLDLAEHVFIPISAVDDHDEEPCAHAFLTAALGQLLLEVLRADGDVCPAMPPGLARTIIRFTEDILADDQGDVADVLRQLEAIGTERAAHPVRKAKA